MKIKYFLVEKTNTIRTCYKATNKPAFWSVENESKTTLISCVACTKANLRGGCRRKKLWTSLVVPSNSFNIPVTGERNKYLEPWFLRFPCSLTGCYQFYARFGSIGFIFRVYQGNRLNMLQAIFGSVIGAFIKKVKRWFIGLLASAFQGLTMLVASCARDKGFSILASLFLLLLGLTQILSSKISSSRVCFDDLTRF